MNAFTQERRLIALESSPLGKDELLLTAFSGQEELSRLFNYQLELLSPRDDIASKEIVGKQVGVSAKYGDHQTRYFNGVVSRFSASGLNMGGMRLYRAELVPCLWFLTRATDCRIFQNKTVPQIIEEIFSDFGLTDYEIAEIKGEHSKWDYCVQYRESAFNFISRLMEQEGIFYWFRHGKGGHTLLLADQQGAYEDLPEKEVEYVSGLPGDTLAKDHISFWEHQYEFLSGRYTQNDYNFETPSTSLKTSIPTLVDLPEVKKYERYDYPGAYQKRNEGDTLTGIRMEEEEVAYDRVSANSNCRSFNPGGKFTLKRHECPSEKKAYLITSITHTATEATYTGVEGGDGKYGNTFTCIPANVTFRPARTTAKPVIHGPQTAVVVGPAGEEIYTDKYGRVKVQFHWDRQGKKDENSSCWVRVSNPWAGKGWGSLAIPRIGQEVIVEFLEGDPDRPIITGRVYNAEQMPPYELPAGGMVSGLKSNSTPGGGGYNEMSMDDTKGKEKVNIHGQYDMSTTVGHDQATTVHNNRTANIDVDDAETVGSNQTIKIGTNQSLDVGSDQATTVHNNRTANIDVDDAETVGSNQTLTIGANQTLGVGNNQTATIGNNQNLQVGNNQILTIGLNQSTSIIGKCTTTIGNSERHTVGSKQTIVIQGVRSATVSANDELVVAGSLTITVTGPISITSTAEISLSVAASNITIDPSGVSITAPQIKLNS